MRGAANSIGFNLWHVARWDDSLFPGLAQQVPALASKLAPPEQVWTRGGLAKAWGMPAQLGEAAPGPVCHATMRRDCAYPKQRS